MSSELDRLLNQTEDQRQAAQKAESTRANAHTLLRDTSSGNLRPLTPSETKYNDPNGRMGVGFQHKSGNLVFLSTDPAKGEIHASVLSGTGPDRPNGAGFTITADGGLKPGSTLGLKSTSDLGDKTLTNDVVRHTDNSFKLSANAGSFSEKIDARWSQAQAGNRMAADVVAGIAADQPGITAPKAVEIGNALTGAEPGTRVKVDHDVLKATAAERDAAHLLRGEARLGGKLTQTFGGAAAGVVVGVGLSTNALAHGATPEEAGKIAIETAVPGGASTMALAENRPMEATLRAIEEVPIAGGVVTELARGPLRAAGADVDPSLTSQIVDIKPIDLNTDQKAFFDTFDRLPNKAQPGMPPEVESLVEAKGMVRQGEANLTAAQNASPGATDKTRALSDAQRSLDTAQNLYQEQYDTLEKSGQMKETVEPWLASNASPAEAKPPAPATPEVATPAPEAKTEEKYTVKPPSPAPAPV